MADDDKRTKIGTGNLRAISSPAVATANDKSGQHTTEMMPSGTPVPSATPPPAHNPNTSYLPPAAPKEDPLLGQVLAGRYLIRKKLGEGGMGAVYLASHQLLEKDVALKVLHNEFSRKPDLVERFIQEAKAASRIRHENVIDISDFGSTPEGVVFFAMELLNGHDLHEEVARARLAGQLLPFSRTKKIFLQICAALSAAHARGIVHRDLKPENVYLVEFLGDPDFVKLLDFGIAKLTEVNEEGRKLTKTGMLFGTPEYMSPEQARGEQVDHRVDIYAMGCILFQLVTGRVPFEADNFMGVLSLHLTEHPPEIPPVVFDRIGAPPALAQVIDKALSKDREQRFQSIDEFANAVRAVSGDAIVEANAGASTTMVRAASVPAPDKTTQSRAVTPAPVSPSPTPVPMVPTTKRTQWTGNLQVPVEEVTAPPQKSKLPLIIGAVAVIAIAGVIAFFATRGDNKDPGTGTPSGSQLVTNPPPPPPTVDAAVTVPQPQLPEYAEIEFKSEPKGADIVEVSTKTVWGKTPKTLKIAGSAAPRQFKYVLKGHTETVFEVIPNKAKMDHFEKLEKGTGTVVVGGGSQTPKNPGSGGSGEVKVEPKPGSGSEVKVEIKPEIKVDAGVKVDTPDCEEVGTCIKTNIQGIKKCTKDDECNNGQSCKDGRCQ